MYEFDIIIEHKIRMNAQSIFSAFRTLDPAQWTLPLCKNSNKLINSYSHDQFQLQIIDLHSLHLLQIYQARADYCFPNTPQIILPKQHHNISKIQVLVQTGSQDLGKYLRKNQRQGLIFNVFTSILTTLQMLTKKYGFFRFTKHMMRITSTQHFLIWINSSFSSNHRELPIHSNNHSQGVRQVFYDIINIFKFYHVSSTLLEIVSEEIKNIQIISYQKILELLTKTNKSHSKKDFSPQLLRNKSPRYNKQRTLTDSREQNSDTHFKDRLNNASKNRYFHVKSLTEFPKMEKLTDFQQKSEIESPSHVKTKKILHIENLKKQGSLIFRDCQKSPKNKITSKLSPKMLKFQSNLKRSFVKKQHQQDDIFNEKNSKKNEFRQSANSQATTTFFTTSITSSGKTKLLEYENFSLKSSTPFISNFNPEGERKTEKIKKYDSRVSKIIEQHHEDPSPCNHSLTGNSYCALGKSRSEQLQKDFDNLMKSQTPRNSGQFSKELRNLESALENILNA